MRKKVEEIFNSRKSKLVLGDEQDVILWKDVPIIIDELLQLPTDDDFCCPECKSKDSAYHNKTNSFICNDCGKEWDSIRSGYAREEGIEWDEEWLKKPRMTEKLKKEIIDEAGKTAMSALGMAFDLCGLEWGIKQTFTDQDERMFVLDFRLVEKDNKGKTA